VALIQGTAHKGSVSGFYPKTIEGSLRFNDDDTASLNWTPDSAGDRTTWTWSGWVKRGTVGTNAKLFHSFGPGGFGIEGGIAFDTSNRIDFLFDYNGGSRLRLVTTAVFRDVSSWYHIQVVADTSNGTTTDRLRLYVNGQRVTNFSTSNYPSTSSYQGTLNQAYAHGIGATATPSAHFDGYLAEVHFTDGTAYDADAFGEFKNGVWVAKTPDVTYGTNGFYLPLTDDTEVEAFNTVLYRGDGSGNQSITGMGMNADLYWIKRRDAAGGWNCVDAIRGTSKRLELHGTGGDYNQTVLQSFDSDGFTTGVTGVGESGGSYVAFGWDAGANNTVTNHSSVMYTGTGATQPITGMGFQPDLVWVKSRTTASHGALFDSVRGSTSILITSLTNAQGVQTDGSIQSFDADGFTLNLDVSTGSSNFSGRNYVAWGWKAGDSNVSNTDGTITSTVRANDTYGFSIVSYTGNGTAGATVGHGLSSAPDFVITKRIDSTGNWFATHSSLSADGKVIYLNLTNGEATSTAIWNDTAPDASTFTLGDGNSNNSGGTFISYCWHDVTGKQKFGSYTGGTDGQKITTGFRPGFVLIKRTSSSGDSWAIFDSSRSPINDGSTEYLFANTNAAEASASNRGVNFVSDGFELVGTDGFINQSGTYIYAAFAGSYSDYITDYNTDGTVDSRVKADDTTGFSVVSWQGDGTTNGTFGHGLSSAPDFIVAKDRDSNSVNNNWHIWHTSLSSTTHNLNFTTGAESNVATATSYGGIGDPSATTIKAVSGTVDSRTMNESGDRYIAYCWTETSGVSKFGSYAGNATSVDLGFNPAFILIKRITGTAKDWWVFDNTREVDGQFGNYLSPNQSYSEQTVASAISVSGNTITFPNNWDSSHDGSSSSTYIYAAFADTREAAFWLDQSGEDNDWQPVNLDHNDTVLDSPTDNFATLNPLVAGNVTLSDGNLKYQHTGSWTTTEAYSTIAIPEGLKFYFEVFQNSVGGAGTYCGVGITSNTTTSTTPYNGVGGWVYLNTGAINHDSTTLSTESSYTTGDTIGVAVDRENGTVKFYKNNTLEYTVSDSDISTGNLFFTVFAYTGTMTTNFGQQPFKYNPPE